MPSPDEVLILGEHEPDGHRDEDTAVTSPSPATESEPPLVLIVDDSEKNRKLARDVLHAGEVPDGGGGLRRGSDRARERAQP